MSELDQLYTPDPQIDVGGIAIDIRRKGTGQPLLLLSGLEGWIRDDAYFDALAEHFDVIAPAHPGFGLSELPPDISSVHDLALFHLTLMDKLDLRDLVLVGTSFGGWVAAELAVRSTERLSALVLVDAMGIKIGNREQRDIQDIYAKSQEELSALMYHDRERNRRNVTQLPEHVLRSIARAREAMAMYGWKPYMHNPTLKRWLSRIDVPTLVLWGESDGLVKPEYGAAYASHIPGATFSVIRQAGHYPHLEQPREFVRQLLAFTRSTEQAVAPAA